MPQPPLEQAIGSSRRWALTVRTSLNEPVTAFDDADPLEAVVWPGDDRAPIFNPSVAWTDVSAGELSLSVAASQVEDVLPGTYRLRITCTPASDGQPRSLLDGSLRLLPAPGSADPQPVYASYETLLDYCPRVGELLDELSDQAGFAEQRARARSWFDEEVLRNYHCTPGRCRRMVDDDGTDAGPYMVYAEPPDGATIPSDAQLRAILDADGLEVTRIIEECVSHKAAAIVYQSSSVGAYANEGARHDGMARGLWYQAVVEVRSDPDLDAPDMRIGRDVTFLT